MTNTNWEKLREVCTEAYMINNYQEMFDYIESLIEQARREEREKVKNKMFNFVDKELKLLGYEHKTIIDKISTI